MSNRGLSVVFLVALQVLAATALAQNDLQPAYEFSFSNPGARSMGLGGAFAALADDATAAFANPAGLVQITKPEVSVEGRAWSYSTPYVSGGRIFGEPTGNGLDNTPELRRAESSVNLAGLSFVSFVVPGKRWALALSRHQLANFETSSALQGLYSGPWSDEIEVRREFDQYKTADFEIVSHSVAGGLQLGDRFSIGLGLSYLTASLLSTSNVYGRDDVSLFYSAVPTIPENLLYSVSLMIDDGDWVFSAGFLWRFARRWRAGGFWRQGSEHGCDVLLDVNPDNSFGVPADRTGVIFSHPMTFPDVYGLGLAYRAPDERLTLSFEWDRVGHSSLLEFFNAPEPLNRLEDGDELRLGAEFLFLRARPMIALRAGAWLEPAHLLYGTGHYVTEAIFPPGDDELHFSVGLGVAFWEVQLDVAVDVSDKVDTASISTVYSF